MEFLAPLDSCRAKKEIGSVLVPELFQAGYHVHVLDSFMLNQASLAECCQSDRFEVTWGDARNKRTIKALLKQAEVVIPLAAVVGMPLCAADETAARTTNAEAVTECGLRRWSASCDCPSSWVRPVADADSPGRHSY